MRVALQTIGCKLNQAESESLARQFIEAGYEVTAPSAHPDIYILNTCTVTHIADRKCRHSIRFARRQNPNTFIIATGCYAERAPEELSEAGADLVIGNKEKENLLEIVKSLGFYASSRATNYSFHTRALVKIQDGCNNFCSYCIVPQTRGSEKSLPSDKIVAEVKKRVAEGYCEVVLTGTQIGNYNYGDGNLGKLIKRILDETNIERVRLSSIHPQNISSSLLNLWGNVRLCRHLHLSLQSGSNSVLKRMKRGYSTEKFKDAVILARKKIPDLAVTTDVIVGFPGESEEEFKESLSFCEEIGFASIHVFPYSGRPGTMAERMPDKIEPKEMKRRVEKMLMLAEESSQHFREILLGKTLPVLYEREKDGIWEGFSDNYVRIFTKTEFPFSGRVVSTKLVAEYKKGLWGNVKEGRLRCREILL
jgi:threonylcarbamoyladenosine tRNA methylthiotransferase MtaB